MTSTSARPSFHEPLRQTLARNLAIAAVVGAVFALLKRRLALWLPISVLALWFSLGGHYAELSFLNQMRPSFRGGGPVCSWAVWWCGFAVGRSCTRAWLSRRVGCPYCRRAAQYNWYRCRLDWWAGGLVLIGIELVAHAVLAWRRLPNFYRGTG